MLQSPAPALINMDPPLSGPSMKAKSLMVPSCMLNSRSGPESEYAFEVETHKINNRQKINNLTLIILLEPAVFFMQTNLVKLNYVSEIK